MDDPKLNVPEALYKSSAPRNVTKAKDTLSNSTVSFRSVSLGFIWQFVEDLKSKKLAPETDLYSLKDDFEGVKAGTTGKLVKSEKNLIHLEVPYRAAPLTVKPDALTLKQREKWTTQDVVEFAILPWMLEKNQCVIDAIPKKFVGKSFTGAFVSQARSCVFADLVDAIVGHAKKKQIGRYDLSKYYVWLDIFSANQPHLCRVHPDESIQKNRYNILTKGLHFAIDNFDERLVFFDDFQQPTPISRAWCVWELYGIAAKDLDFEVICTANTSNELMVQFIGGSFLVDELFSSLDIKSMSCYNPEDLKMIQTAVESLTGGFSQLKQAVTEKMRKWLIGFINDVRVNRLAELRRLSAIKKEPLNSIYQQADGELLLYSASVFENSGQVALAIYYQTSAMNIFHACHASPRAATAMVRLGASYAMIGRHDAAVNFYKLALVYYNKLSVDKEHEELDYAGCIVGLGASCINLNELDHANALFNEAIEIYEHYYGPQSLKIANILNNKSTILARQGKHEEALKLSLQSLDIATGVLGEGHIDLAAKYYNVAGGYKELGDFQRAVEYGFKALHIYQEVYGEGHQQTAFAHRTLAFYLQNCGKFEASEKHYKTALEYLDKYMAGGNWTADAHFDFGLLYKGMGKSQKATEHLMLAKKYYTNMFGAKSKEVEKVKKEL